MTKLTRLQKHTPEIRRKDVFFFHSYQSIENEYSAQFFLVQDKDELNSQKIFNGPLKKG